MSNYIQNFQSQINAGNVDRKGQSGFQATATAVTGQFRVNGQGEAQIDVTFPTRFVEKPILSFGAELIEGDSQVPGFMPWANVCVLSWTTKESPPQGRLYLGARLGVVSGGVSFQKMMVHWSFNGKALKSPA